MKTFIRVVESWVPSGDRSLLEFGGGMYGEATRFGAASRSMCCARGQGLPGQAWEQCRPIVLTHFEGSYCQHTRFAQAEGLTCGIAVPIFAGEFLTSVLGTFCGDDEAHAGTIERWRHDPAEAPEMNLADGYYGHPAEAFEGLPGAGQRKLWEGLSVGARNPIVQRFECGEPDSTRQRLVRTGGFCGSDGLLPPMPSGPMPERGQGAVGRAFLTGVPASSDKAASEPGRIGASTTAAGLSSVVAVPILRGGKLAAAVAW